MIDEQRLRRWIGDIRRGRRTLNAVVDELRRLPFDDLGFARLDTHRRLRRGLPEVVFGDGKTPDQLIRIIRRLSQAEELILITRLDPDAFTEIRGALPSLRYDPIARVAYGPPRSRRSLRGFVPVVTGGPLIFRSPRKRASRLSCSAAGQLGCTTSVWLECTASSANGGCCSVPEPLWSSPVWKAHWPAWWPDWCRARSSPFRRVLGMGPASRA